MDVDPLVGVRTKGRGLRDLQDRTVKSNRVVLSHGALLFEVKSRVASLLLIFRRSKLDEDQRRRFDPNRSTPSEVARCFARDAATLGTLISRLSGRVKADEGMRREIEKPTKKVET